MPQCLDCGNLFKNLKAPFVCSLCAQLAGPPPSPTTPHSSTPSLRNGNTISDRNGNRAPRSSTAPLSVTSFADRNHTRDALVLQKLAACRDAVRTERPLKRKLPGTDMASKTRLTLLLYFPQLIELALEFCFPPSHGNDCYRIVGNIHHPFRDRRASSDHGGRERERARAI